MAAQNSSARRARYLILAIIFVVGGIVAIVTRDNGWSGWKLTETLGSALAILLGLSFLKKAADA